MIAEAYWSIVAVQESLRLRAFNAVGLFVRCGYPTPGPVSHRWVFRLPDVGQPTGTSLGLTWPQFGYALPFDVSTPETATCRGVAIPVLTSANADRDILVHPFVCTMLQPGPTVLVDDVLHSHSIRGMDAIRRDFMCPIPVEHIDVDGVVTVL